MLYFWANKYTQQDQERYRLIEVEKSHEFSLANGMNVTLRWDLLVLDLVTNRYYLFDTKTTGWSISQSYKTLELNDQPTMYLLGLSHIYPDIYERTVGLIPDIIYCRVQKTTINVQAERPGTILRTKNRIIEYEQELIGLFVEMSQKVKALEEGFPYPHMLFPRNGSHNAMFGTDWPQLYDLVLPNDPHKPIPGYTIDHDLIENGPYRDVHTLDSSYPLTIQGVST